MSVATAEPQSREDHISTRNFERLGRFIYDYSGIKMPDAKRTMLEGRLRRRLRATGHGSFDQYCTFLFEGGGMETEVVHLIDVVTTNKTDFFREPRHFEFLRDVALPSLVEEYRTIKVWSAACSIGAEPYSIAMVLEDHAAAHAGFSYSILATDLSTDVLERAHRGIFPADMVVPVPKPMRQRYVMASRDDSCDDVRIHPSLRQKIAFGRMNLMDDIYPITVQMQLVFCRNVLIYFDKPTQLRVLSRLCERIAPGGYLFIGHSESVTGFDLPLVQVSNTVFQRV